MSDEFLELDEPGDRRVVVAEAADVGERIDRFLAARLPDLSRARIQALMRQGAVSASGRTLKDPSAKINAGEIVVAVPPPAPAEPVAQDIPLEVVFEELLEGPVAGLGELSVEAFLVDHRPVEPAFGLALSHGGTRLVFSGDTRLTPSLETQAAGCDLLVCEVFIASQMPVVAGVRSAQTVAAVESYHMTPAIVAGLATRAGAKALALTHLVPPNADTAALAREIRAAGYDGALLVGEDLMRIDVPERLLRWNGATIAY